jgi:cellulose synthase/poly-beta-1,6-N-acetylglucosamine synthase-like glycosyltransferase
MSTVLVQVLCVTSALLALPAAVLFVEVILALARRPRAVPPRRGPRPRVAVLVPAHNEAANIIGTLRSIAPQLSSSDRLIVVADNCVDETAALARREGCEVLTRRDEQHRGKGYALDAGVRYLQAHAPEVLIVIDADSRIEPGFIDRLARRCASSGRPAQAKYLMTAPPEAGLKTRIAAFAWVVKNYLRPSGLQRAGLPCQLMGSGMAFPWACIRAAKLSSGHIVEDLKLGIELALRGHPTSFCPEAVVTSPFPASREGLRTQRARWEHGHLGVILSDAPALFWQSLRQRDLGLLALALDLCVPPLALLVLGMWSVLVADTVLLVTAHSLLPLALAALAMSMLGTAVLLAWSHDGRQIASLGTLALSMVYALSKLPLYLRFATARQTEWVRSRRDGDQAEGHYWVANRKG